MRNETKYGRFQFGSTLQRCCAFNREERMVVRAVYEALAEGSAVPISRVASDVNLPARVITRILEKGPGLTHFDHDGRIRGFLGLSVSRTSHRLEVNGRTLYAWCAWDSLFIPGILRTTARVSSRCPITGDPIQLIVDSDRIVNVDPPDTMLSFQTTCDTDMGTGMEGVCCEQVHFLSSSAAVERWEVSHPEGAVLALDEAMELARSFVGTLQGEAST